ncbi:MAG: hypothetical protein ACOZIN_16020 [Myxococcota bacterium]
MMAVRMALAAVFLFALGGQKTSPDELQALRVELEELQVELAGAQLELETLLAEAGMLEEPPTELLSAQFPARVESVSDGEVRVRDAQGKIYELGVDSGTRAFEGARRIEVESLPEGSVVRASLAVVDGELMARELVLLDVK